MNNDQITVLAREFSKEHDDSTIAYQAAKDVIHFLLRRFCLVEKSKVKEEYNLALSNFEKAGCARPLNQSYFEGESIAIKSLLPGIAKEVEG